MAATDILGIATIFLAGDYTPSMENARLDPGGLARTTKAGDQVHGPTATSKPSKLTARFPAQNGISVVSLNAFRGPITYQGDNGVSYIISDAWCMGDAAVTNGPTGEIAASFEGQPADEMGVSP